MNFDDPELLATVAGEYVLGTLDEAERREVEQALPRQPKLAAEVAAWQDRLLGLTRRVAPQAPSAGLWSHIEAGLASAGVGTARVEAANAPFWDRLGVWRSIGGVAVAAALLMAVLLGQSRSPPVADERYVTVLQSPDRAAGWIIETTAGGPLKLVPIAAQAAVPAGKSLQFWTKLDGAAGPTSLGRVHAGEPLEVARSRLPGVASQQLFEITLEPENGSPLNRPTGPILFIGRSVRVG